MKIQTAQQAAISVAHSMITIAHAATKLATSVEKLVNHRVSPYAPLRTKN